LGLGVAIAELENGAEKKLGLLRFFKNPKKHQMSKIVNQDV